MQSIDERSIGWAYVSPIRRERIEAGIAALARIDKHVTFYDWHMVGQALIDLKDAAQYQSGANKATGKGYNAAWARCVADNPELAPLAKLDSATRTNAMWLADYWGTVAEWHAKLDDATRRLVNHPATVRRRYSQDHPLPAKPRNAGAEDLYNAEDLYDSDEDELDEESREVYDIEADSEREDADIPETVEDCIKAFEALWRRMPRRVRAEIAQRIALWQSETVARESLEEPAELDLIDEADAEISRAVAKTKGAKVRALAATKTATSTSGATSPERVAMIAAEVAANPLPEGEDPFVGLGLDDTLGQRRATMETVLARRPSLIVAHARIIAARLNNPDWDDQALAEYTKRTASTVRRILDENGFKPQ